MSPTEYLRQLNASRERLRLLDQSQKYTAEERSLEASFGLSWEQLSKENQRMFGQLAMFPVSFDEAAARAVWAVEEPVATDTLGELMRLSLAEWKEEGGRYELHDLVREYAGGHLTASDRGLACRRHAGHFTKVAREANNRYLAGGEEVVKGLALFDRERRNIEGAFEYLRGESGLGWELVALVDAVVYTSHLRFHAREGIRWLEAQLKAARELGYRQGEGVALGNLGIAYRHLGDTCKAIEFHEQSLVIDRELGDRRGEGADLGNLGNAYAALGDARKAIGFYEQVLVIYRELRDRRGEGNALGDLGNAFADLDDARKAIEFHEQHLQIAREIGDRWGEGNALFNSALSLNKLGNRGEAITRAKAALRILDQVEDPNAVKVGNQLLEWGEMEGDSPST